jgi:glycosyltransferase involved in cell wall biosynthesis
MKILMLAEHYAPAEQGGSAESVRLEAEALVRLGHVVTILTPKWVYETPNEECRNGVDVIRFPVLATARERDYWKSGGWKDVMAAYADVMMPTDVVHAQDWRSFGALCQVKDWRTKRVVTLRDVGLLCPIAVCLLSRITIPADCGQAKLALECVPEFVRQYGGHAARVQRGLGYNWRRRLLERLRDVTTIFPSKALHDVYEPVCGSFGAGTAIVPSPVNPELPVDLDEAAELRRRYRLGDATTVLFVGKPSPGKGWNLFTEAARKSAGIARANPDAFGPFPIFAHVGTNDRNHPDVLSLGPMQREDVLKWMRASTFVMIPPLQCDTLPRTALEAQAQERYVVGTNRGGLPEIVDNFASGRITDPGNVVAQTLLTIDGIRRRYNIGWPWNRPYARQQVLARFSQATIVEKLVRVYRGEQP